MCKRLFLSLMIVSMLMSSFPIGVFAGDGFNYEKIDDQKALFLNNEPVQTPAELGQDPKTKDEANSQIKNLAMPKLYNIKTEYKAIKDGEPVHLFQPYEATVGDDEYTYKDYKGNERKLITADEKKKIKKDVYLPEIDGYTKPTEKTDINYDYVKNKAKQELPTGNKYVAVHKYNYEAYEREIKVKHVFQNLYDKNEYGLKDGENEYTYTEVKGAVGSQITVSPLPEKLRKGYVPEKTVITTRVPDNIKDFVIEYRYNRDSFAVSYDMDGGRYIPSQKLYYGQTIPNLNAKPQKRGAIFVGWKSDTDLHYKDTDGNVKTLPKDKKFEMKDFPDGIKDAMPAKDIKFTALWKEEPKANYTIQFWTEKADSDDYDYIGAKIVKDADTGSRPDLSLMMPSGIKFPEIDKNVTDAGKEKELNKYYVRNNEKIAKENTEKVAQSDGTNVALTKKVQPDGSTTYNIYYDRQTYTMLFEKFGIDNPEYGYPAKEAKMVLPDGTKYDSTKEVNKPYNFKAKFGERMTKWPNDMWLIGEGGIDFDPNRSFIGWQLNSENNNNEDQSLYLDTPPYWLTSKDFIDVDYGAMDPDVKRATHSTSTGELLPERTISLGPSSSEQYQFAIYYMEYLFEGIDGELHYNPDMSYTKIDTSGAYSYPAPGIVGFKPKWNLIDPFNDAKERPAKRKGHTEDLSKLTFSELEAKLDKSEANRKNNEKSFFDPIAEKGINGVPFKDIPKYRFAFTYEREDYNLFLDSDPTDINENSYFAGKKLASGKSATINNVKYEYPLRKLNLDEEYKLTEADRPTGVPDDFVFKGWSVDPQGTKLIKDTIKDAENLESQIAEKYSELEKNSKNKEKKHAIRNEIKELKSRLADVDANMPNYDTILYAKWGEPDKNYEIRFDPDKGTLADIDPMDIATFDDGEMIQTSVDKIAYTLPEKLDNEGDVQVFSVKSRTSIKEPPEPKRKGYDFLGWEIVRHNKNGSVDTSYKDKYDVPELYAFGNEVVENAYLKAIWVKNDLIDIPVFHYTLDENFKEKVNQRKKTTVINRRVGEYANAVATYQGDNKLTIPEAEWKKLENKSSEYKEYTEKTGRKNTYSQTFKVEPQKIKQDGQIVDNPKVENNVFKFFYREFTKRHYKVNYLSTTEQDADKLPAVGNMPDGSFKIIDTEEVTDGNNDFDSVNYREIPGWKIISAPQRQIFFDFDADGEVKGINGVDSTEVNFYYQDVRVIKRKTPEAATPDGYHRVVFKADRDGSFGKDADGKAIKEVVYDVIDGLEFKNIGVPPEQNQGGTLKSPVITPDPNAEFVGWEDARLLDENTLIRRDYTFTAKFKPLKDVIEIKTGDEEVQDYFVDVYVDTTDKADANIKDNQHTGDKKLHFKVNPEKQVEIPVKEPKGDIAKGPDGKDLTSAIGEKLFWQFSKWKIVDVDKTWDKGTKISDKFTNKSTTIVAKYNLKQTPLEPVPELKSDSISVFESSKDGSGAWINNFMPTKEQYDKALKDVMKTDGYKSYKVITTEEEIFNKIKENGDPVGDGKPRTFEINVEVTFENGMKRVVKMPVNVFSNVYRGLNNGDKPDVVKKNDELKDFVKVTVNPTNLSKDKQQKVYYVNPNAKVTIPESNPTPVDNYTFEGWYYIDKDKVSESNPKGRVKVDLSELQNIPKDREIIASYSTAITPLIPLEPEAKTIIKNIGDSLTVDDYKDAITPPEGRKIRAINIVKPKDQRVTTEKDGKFKETIEVIYDDGASSEIDVNVVVVPDYVIQTGDEKPDVPKDFIKVVVDYTDRAKLDDPADMKRIFWVNPKVKVTLPADKPVGLTNNEKKFTWEFDFWQVDENNGKKYNDEITDTFTKEVTIKARYHVDMKPMIPAVKYIKEKMVIKGGNVSAKDFITNRYNDDDPANKDNLPPGTKFSFIVPPNTDVVGEQPAKIKVNYPNGEEVIVEVKINVIDDVVPQKGDEKPKVPDNYVKVVVDYTKNAKLEDGQEIKQVFWVNPDKEVKILDSDPIGKEKWTFEKWTVGEKQISLTLKNKFTDKETVVRASFSYKPVEIQPLEPETDVVQTYVGKLPENNEYIDKIKVPDGLEIDHIDIIENPDVSKPGNTQAKIQVFYKDGSSVGTPEKPILVDVVVKANIYPADKDGNRTGDTPKNYVRVIVDPTEKAEDSEKKIYYVNPEVDLKLDIKEPQAKEHWNFVNWKSNGEVFDTDAEHKFQGETIIKAEYEKDPLVTFIQVYSDGALKAQKSEYVKKNSKLQAPNAPVKGTVEGNWVFRGWYENMDFDTSFNFDDAVVTDDITVYGVWDKKPVVPGSGNGGSSQNGRGDRISKSPITGDNSIGMYLYAMGISAGIALLSLFARKRIGDK